MVTRTAGRAVAFVFLGLVRGWRGGGGDVTLTHRQSGAVAGILAKARMSRSLRALAPPCVCLCARASTSSAAAAAASSRSLRVPAWTSPRVSKGEAAT